MRLAERASVSDPLPAVPALPLTRGRIAGVPSVYSPPREGESRRSRQGVAHTPCFVAALTVLTVLLLSLEAFSQSPDTLFQSRCAQCHSTNNTVNAPLPDTLRRMSWQAVLTALETGKMKGIGDALTVNERETIAKYIGTDNAAAMPSSAKC